MTNSEERTVKGYVAEWLRIDFVSGSNESGYSCSFDLNTRTELASESERFSIRVPQALAPWFIAHDISDFNHLVVTIRKQTDGWLLLEAGKLNRGDDDKYSDSETND